ncbi:Pimeloyl-ACP methyl ester carboxylesterase [Duganella sacchari]|uniref:Pimeloyl-ACP methyl ester carboxylesterase n=1 Tax=Duganella sacchari TaxID=551987 RepID=A0A1M7RCA8_9BURK|nr:alpha/beta hydrolase [Duganella sacchari]SHN43917.1 Pimeloyl-ACP methyl ester carboxylesterase [Duganella sacchari]
MTRLDLVPGTLCDERMWGRLLPLLGDGFEFHHVPLHKARSRAQMQELIGAHTAPKANLVAFSLGAYLAVEYALANPERVNSLVIIASSARGLQEKEKATRLRIIPLLEKNHYTGMTQMRLREILAPEHMDDPAIVDVIQAMAVELGKDVLLTQFRTTIERPDLMSRTGELRCRVLAIASEQDKLVAADDVREFSRYNPAIELHVLQEGTGHMIPLEAPQALASHLLNFYRAP